MARAAETGTIVGTGRVGVAVRTGRTVGMVCFGGRVAAVVLEGGSDRRCCEHPERDEQLQQRRPPPIFSVRFRCPAVGSIVHHSSCPHRGHDKAYGALIAVSRKDKPAGDGTGDQVCRVARFMISVTRASKGMPAAAAISGAKLSSVMPGIVLISSTMGAVASEAMRSMRARPAQPRAS